MLSYSVDFKAPLELWNALSKAVPGKYHGFGGHTKCYCLQDPVNLQDPANVLGKANCPNF